MKMLFSSQTALEVGLLKGLLDEAGIPCEVRNENTHANLPGAVFQPEIWVFNDTDYERACDVRDGWRQSVSTQVSERVEDRAYAPALRLMGLVCLAACAFMVWQGIRAGDGGRAVAAASLFGFMAVAMFVAAWQLRPLRRNKTGRRS